MFGVSNGDLLFRFYLAYLQCYVPGLPVLHKAFFIMPPTSQKLGEAYCFWVVHPSVRPFVTLFDAQHNFRTVNATVLKFLIWIPHEKIADTYFFS